MWTERSYCCNKCDSGWKLCKSSEGDSKVVVTSDNVIVGGEEGRKGRTEWVMGKWKGQWLASDAALADRRVEVAASNLMG